MATSATRTPNIMTVDLEEWFVVQALQSAYNINNWTSLPSTLEANTQRLLDLFETHEVTATFFVLGWCAKEHPATIRRIANAGHEIACHSFYHRRVDQMEPDEFRRDTLRAMHAIIDACGVRPRGYRAPTWSINDSIPWAFEILSELGFDYDSSIFPIKHDLYGMPHGPREVFRMKCRNERFLYEVPASTYRFMGKNVPAAGGGYFRHTPYWYTRQVVKHLNRHQRPAVIYIHPWELDPDPPRMEGLSSLQKLRSYGSTHILALKLHKLLSQFEFTTMRYFLAQQRRQPIGFQRS